MKKFYILTGGEDVIASEDGDGVKAVAFEYFEDLYNDNSHIDINGRRQTDYREILKSVSMDDADYIEIDGRRARSMAEVFFNGVAKNKIVAQYVGE